MTAVRARIAGRLRIFRLRMIGRSRTDRLPMTGRLGTDWPRIADRLCTKDRLLIAWRLVRELTGERTYEIYLEHQRTHHPDAPVLAERDFWRHRMDARDATPRASCC